MTQEDKELLLKDLCARLPYGVKVKSSMGRTDVILSLNIMTDLCLGCNIKPYLRPMSSMTDKELIEFLHIRGMNLNSDALKTFRNGETAIVSTLPLYSRHIDWLNAHHFDYRGLIEKGLAINATGLNIY